MESLSRPFHSRKLSNATSFSAKNAYADAFSGHRHKFSGASTIDVADYREIFGSSQANCSIPVLDASTLSDASNLNLRHSKPDYSNIFGGFRDEQIAYYELFNRDKRGPSLKEPTSQDLDNSFNQSTYNMSYNKISPKSKDELNGTKHVTQLPATPGFIRFIDEPVLVSSPKTEANNSKSSPVRVTVDSSKENVSVPKVRKSNTFDIDFGIHSRSNAAMNFESYKTDTSESGPGGFSRTDIDAEVVNSDASASAAALKKAIEKAQESIRIAKESVGRKKKGLKSFSKKCKMENVNVDTSSQVLADVRTNRKYADKVNYEDLMDGEKLFVAKKVIDEMNGKILESSNECCNRFEDNNTIVSKPAQVMCETESIPFDSAEKDECAKSSFEVVDTEKSRTESSDVIYAYRTSNMFVESVERAYEPDEIADVDVSQNVEDEKEDFRESSQPDNEQRSNEKQETAEEAQTYDIGIEDTEVNIRHDYEIRQEDNRAYEIKEEYDEVSSCDDNVVEETEKVNLRDDYEIRKEDDHNRADEIKEYDEVSSFDDNVVEETDGIDEIRVASNVVNTSDDVETNQDVDDVAVAGAFRESEVEETELMKEADASDEEEAFSNDVEDDNEVKLEENDTQSESSSGTVHDVQLEVEEESNEQKNIPEETNIQVPDNKIPDVNDTEKTAVDEIEETGPSKVYVKEDSRRIAERTAKNNRLAVERAIHEARERAFAEARERAERDRAAVEKATEEVRQRMMADVIEKVAGNKSSSSSEKTSANSKLRAERAAVERATKEARQRALEKAISQKNVSDLNISESALRTKAKLEKHNRIMERAAKALAEKEKRDLLAQKEQAERNRLAENLDADIKRWSNGKEKNLRALLSTLQYILGPESGWKPITMTEIISSNAVKKAYRKATLCVHPDKLQQRGASIQHKYICEKVFDLLKAAWNRFNSEEK
ncbi:uncharacterized protein [Rutidosis leptorrhynchoides]|uniref:uncharacterized protein n=1 Tax=Rutidosis leptorrhynchoides TaxID=125765 RepID=UPI003A9A160A